MQVQQQGQEQQNQPQVNGKTSNYDNQITERVETVSSLGTRMSESAKNAKATGQMRGVIVKLAARRKSDRIGFKL